MKKLFYVLLLLPLFLISCNDDDDNFPQVKIELNTKGATIVDGVIYIVQGDLFSIDELLVVSSDANNRVVIGSASFYWDRLFVGSTSIAPFKFIIDTYTQVVGYHLLQIRCTLLSIDYSPIVGIITLPVKIVESVNDIPQGDQSTLFHVYPDIDD